MDLHSGNKTQEEPFVSGIKEDHACLLEEKKNGREAVCREEGNYEGERVHLC